MVRVFLSDLVGVVKADLVALLSAKDKKSFHRGEIDFVIADVDGLDGLMAHKVNILREEVI